MKKINKLASIQNREDIKSLKIVEKFEDDHLQCAVVKINDIEVHFNHLDDLGFLTYWKDSNEAFDDLKYWISNCIEIENDN